MQRKNPRKIAWTVLYRRMHKKGLTEEVAKKRSRKTVKHQRGIVGADLAAIAARRNQSAAARTEARTAAIAKAKAAKKEKEGKKTKVRSLSSCRNLIIRLKYVSLSFPQAAAPRTTNTAPKVSKQQMKGGKASGR